MSESSGHLWATTISWRASSRNGWQRSGNCGTQSHQSQTGAPPVHKASVSSSVAHGSTTTVCKICAWARLWDAAHDGSFDAGRDGTQHHQSTQRQAHSGPHGLTRCPSSNNVCHVSLVNSCTTSPTMTHWSVWARCRSRRPDWTSTTLRRGVRPRPPLIVVASLLAALFVF